MEEKLESTIEPIEEMIARRWASFRMRLADWLGGIRAKVSGESGPARHSILLLLCLGITLNLIVIAAPGYWGAEDYEYIQRASFDQITWFDFLGFSESHEYRPLANNLRLILAIAFHDIPVFQHLAVVLLGSINGVLFYLLLHRVTGQAQRALWGFVVFVVFAPTAIGWVSVLGAPLWMMFFLLIAHLLFWDRSEALRASPQGGGGWRLGRAEIWRQIAIALLFILGLMSQEYMIILPAAIAGLRFFSRPWRGWFWALLVTAIIAAFYLLLRAPGLFGPLPAVLTGYQRSLAFVIPNVLRYWLYPYAWTNYEIPHLLNPPSDLYPELGADRLVLLMAGIFSFFPVVLFIVRKKWCWAISFLFYYYLFTAPVLLIENSSSRYLYGSALPVAAALAYFLRSGERYWVRAIASLMIATLVLHGVRVQIFMYRESDIIWRIRSNFSSIARSFDNRVGHSRTNFRFSVEEDFRWWVVSRALWSGPAVMGEMDLRGRFTPYLPPGHPLREIEQLQPKENAVELRVTRDGYIYEP